MNGKDQRLIEELYNNASKKYAEFGIDTGSVLKDLGKISISMHCWQGDDVGGFEKPGARLEGSGIQATGNYPGKARNIEELQQDILKALELVPGAHRVNIHAMYGDFTSGHVERTGISVEHFQRWIDWALANDLKLDFNATLFSHPKADSGFTLSHKSSDIRDFWIRHVNACREIAREIGRQQKSPCIHNLWIPDGMKDIPVDRIGHRQLLIDSLDKIFNTRYSKEEMKDFIEGKLFGIGSESFVVGSHDFYLGYAASRKIGLTMDMGHYHPTESVADKISAVLPFVPEILIHVSRGVRWDSDHVVILDDHLRSVAEEITWSCYDDRIHLALDYFDASINRIAAWVIGMRATMFAMLQAMLFPIETVRELEAQGNYTKRLAMLEEFKHMPANAIWDKFCLDNNVPPGTGWIKEIEDYEREILSKRT
ncbi:MAG: L-rhamnose isomerase [Promethearchaeota archaeon]